jgi:hypothetical protein
MGASASGKTDYATKGNGFENEKKNWNLSKVILSLFFSIMI